MAKQTTAPASRRVQPGRTATARRRTTGERSLVTFAFSLDRFNFIGLGIGIAVIVLGYLLMSTGIADDPANNDGIWNNAASVTFGPILLVLGYCVIVPLSLLYRRRRGDDARDAVDA